MIYIQERVWKYRLLTSGHFVSALMGHHVLICDVAFVVSTRRYIYLTNPAMHLCSEWCIVGYERGALWDL